MLSHALVEEAIILIIYLVFILPFISVFLGLFIVTFTARASEIKRSEYRNRLLFWLAVTCLFILLGAGSHHYFISGSQVLDESYNRADGLISRLLLWSIPILFFSICTGNAAKHLNSIGSNRFISLIGHLPSIGLPFLIWFAFTKKVSHKRN